MKLLTKFASDIYLDLSVFTIFLIYILRYFNRSSLWQITGLILSLSFVALWIFARINLGVAFTVRPEATKLVTTGLYSKIKHPIYLFSTLSFLSLLLIYHPKFLYFVGILIIAIQIYRGTIGNKKLKEVFSVEYNKYEQKTLI